MNPTKVCAKVPASTANLGPGFDSLGMALNLYSWIEMDVAEKTVIHLHGGEMQGIPTDKSNLIYKVAQDVFRRAGVSYPELEISMHSEIPLTRGLGSSASAIVGAMAAANALIGSPLSDDELFQMAAAMEKHPDNVGASLFGGLIVSYWDGERAEYIRIEPEESLEIMVAIPRFQLATEKARNVLPKELSMGDAVFNIGHSSLLVAAFATGRYDMIAKAMKDAVHQPYRAALIPGMERILGEATDHGALGAALSGAGPTVLALVDSKAGKQQELESFLLEAFRSAQVEADIRLLKPCRSGVQCWNVTPGNRTLIESIQGETVQNP
ncbi:homoserine kinase [Paenibacillus aurantius]|uniref:Homoserine kinase n=1 Tax=Paenibacillus aurantius TaxID=2918900 RepID=A0AA96RH51_9BACL|nr:homoserine kinase [Paenibacillus aurantius]WNQ12988.1 homoserine kinase [Paenibacillus aurantius]